MSDAAPLLFLLVAIGIFWFFVLRPTRKQQREVQQLQSELAVGQEIVMSSGIFGTIRGLTDARAEVEVAPGTVVTVARQVVVRRVEDVPEESAQPRDPAADETGDGPRPDLRG